MPVYRIEPPGDEPSAVLEARGPLVLAQIGVPELLARNLRAHGLEIPEDQRGPCVVDTGASLTGVDLGVAQALGLPPFTTAVVCTPTGTEERSVYVVRLEFPGSGLPTRDPARVLGVDLEPLGLAALIGRDFLRELVMVYDGTAGTVTLAY